MQIVQRGCMIFVAVVVFLLGATVVYRGKEEKLHQQWEIVQAERFLNRICRSGSCSYEDYLIFHKALNYYGMDSDITIEEFKEEQDMDKKTYYYLISWEEVQSCMLEEGMYKFELGSIIRIAVKQKSRMQSRASRYFGVVSGRE